MRKRDQETKVSTRASIELLQNATSDPCPINTLRSTRNRLPRHHQIHRREQALSPSSYKCISSSRQLSSSFRGPQRRQPQRLQRAQQNPNTNPSDTAHPQHPKEVPQSLRTPPIARQRRIPRPPVRDRRNIPLSKIFLVLNNKTSFLHRFQRFFPRHHIGNSTPSLNAQANIPMVFVAIVVGVRHNPFVNSKDTTRFKHAEDLRVDAFEGGCVDGCLDCVGCVEGVGREVDFLREQSQQLGSVVRLTQRTHHEIPTHKPNPPLQLLSHSMRRRSLHLILVVVQPNHFTARESRYLSRGLANATPDIEHGHGSIDADPVSEIVFVAGQGLQERFARGEATEVEGLRPGFFVEVGGEVVVAWEHSLAFDQEMFGTQAERNRKSDSLVHKGHVISFASLSTAFDVANVVVGVPPSNVLSRDGSVSFAIFL